EIGEKIGVTKQAIQQQFKRLLSSNFIEKMGKAYNRSPEEIDRLMGENLLPKVGRPPKEKTILETTKVTEPEDQTQEGRLALWHSLALTENVLSENISNHFGKEH